MKSAGWTLVPAAPEFRDPVVHRVAEVVHVVLLLGVYVWVGMIVGGAAVGEPPLYLTSYIALLAIASLGLVINRRHPAAAAILYSVSLTAYLIGATILTGGIQAPGIAAFGVLVFVVGLMLGAAGAMPLAGLLSVYSWILVWLNRSGRLTESVLPLDEANYGLAVTATVLSTAVLITWIRRSIVRALAESRENLGKYQSLFEGAPDGIIALSGEGLIEAVNPALVKLTGQSAERVVGRRVDALTGLGEEAGCRLEGAVDRLVRGESIGSFELELPRAMGPVSIEVHGQRTVRSDGSSGVQLVLHDVVETERERLRDRLLHAEKMEAVGVLAGGVAHDFNNLLTVVEGHSSLIMEDPLSPGATRRSAAEIHRAQDRGAKLVEQLMTYASRQVVQPVPTDLDQLVLGLQGLVRPVFGAKIELVLDVAQGVTVLGDPGQIEQVLMNLFLNARDAMPEGGELRVLTESRVVVEPLEYGDQVVQPGRYGIVELRDTGSGMDESTSRRALEPFFTTKETGMGTGLGLSAALGIVNQHDGYLTIDSSPGEGTTITVYLPLELGDLARDDPGRDVEGNGANGHPFVLVVDDDISVLELVRLTLERAGFEVAAAESGEEALRVVAEKAEPIDLLLTDVVMPGMRGTELARQVELTRPGIGILHMTGYAGEALARELGEATNLALIAKPFTRRDLVRRVREVLHSRA